MTRRKIARNRLAEQTCKQITDLVLGYLNQQLSPQVRRDFEHHLTVCPDCVNFFRTYKKTIQMTGSVDPAAMPAQVRENILQFLRKQIRRVGSVILCIISQLAA